MNRKIQNVQKFMKFHTPKTHQEINSKRMKLGVSGPRDKALASLNTECPLSASVIIICSATLFHEPSGLWACVA